MQAVVSTAMCAKGREADTVLFIRTVPFVIGIKQSNQTKNSNASPPHRTEHTHTNQETVDLAISKQSASR